MQRERGHEPMRCPSPWWL